MCNQENAGTTIGCRAKNFKHVTPVHRIKRRCRLIGQDQIWLSCKPYRNQHTLPHTATQLMRESVSDTGIIQANSSKGLDAPGLPRSATRSMPSPSRFEHLPVDSHDGIKRGHWLLKDHADIAATKCSAFRFTHATDVPAINTYLTLGAANRCRKQAQYGKRGQGLTAARLTDKRRHAARLKAQINAVDKHLAVPRLNS
jgi:hypothetical protein